jgi:hypothetical protein
MIENIVYLFTGGDDNAVHLTEVNFGTSLRCRLISSFLDAHTSTITGVLDLGNLQFLSIGIDQCIRVWGYNGHNLVCLHKAYTFVADVCGIVEIGISESKRRFVVFGTGMEMIAWETAESINSCHKSTYE